MQALHFLQAKFENFWHITRLSRTKRHKVINSQKRSGFWPTLYTVNTKQFFKHTR